VSGSFRRVGDASLSATRHEPTVIPTMICGRGYSRRACSGSRAVEVSAARDRPTDKAIETEMAEKRKTAEEASEESELVTDHPPP